MLLPAVGQAPCHRNGSKPLFTCPPDMHGLPHPLQVTGDQLHMVFMPFGEAPSTRVHAPLHLTLNPILLHCTWQVSEEQLRMVFMPFGEVSYTKIPPGKGCGFVHYLERRAAEFAIKVRGLRR